MRANIQLLRRASSECKHTAHFCVVGCKEGGRLNNTLAMPYIGLRRKLFKKSLSFLKFMVQSGPTSSSCGGLRPNVSIQPTSV